MFLIQNPYNRFSTEYIFFSNQIDPRWKYCLIRVMVLTQKKMIIGMNMRSNRFLIKYNKMKKTKIFAFTLATMVFAACSNDDVIPDNGNTSSTGDAWLALSIKQGPNTRALNNPDQDNGNQPSESTISSIKVVLFDNDATDPKVLGEASLASISAAATPFKVPKDSKRLLVVVNPPSSMYIAKGMTYSTVNAAVTATVESLIGIGKNNFMMTNASGTLLPRDASGQYQDLVPKQKPEDVTPISVNVDRVVSKVRVYNTYAGGADLPVVSDLEWVLNVTNKQYYPVSQRTETQNELDGKGYVWSDQFEDGSWRIDPNYSTQPAPADYANHYNTFASAAAVTTWQTVGATSASTTYEYCLENTQTSETSNLGYSTQVLLKAKVLPSKAADGDVSTGNTEGHFLQINGHYFTFATLWDIITTEKSLQNKPYTTAFNLFLTTQGITPAISDGTTEAEFLSIKDEVMAKGSANAGAVRFFLGGYSYYNILIKHDDLGTGLNALGKFGVVRNSVYDVNITKFSMPGEPIVIIPDPVIPDEEEDYYLSVDITINPWTWYTQNEEL